MAWDDERARTLQQSIRHDEIHDDTDYGEIRVKRSVVHAREDVVLLVSYLSSANRHLRGITNILWLIAIVLIYIAYRLTFPR
jgi:hypothetical protein